MFVTLRDDKISSSFDEDSEVLQVLGVQPWIPNNGKLHKTKNYSIMQQEKGLVLRRGQFFFISLKLNRPYNAVFDEINLVFKMDNEFNIFDKNDEIPEISVPVMNFAESKKTWFASVDSADSTEMKIMVTIPADAYIAKYNFSVSTNTKSCVTRASNFNIEELFYIIFNPWCQDDDVYMDNEANRQEYVLSQSGLIWTGNTNDLKSIPWYYHQFDNDVIDCAFYLINAKSNVNVTDRNNPVLISRCLTALANGNDDDQGILEGRWDGDYKDGNHPCSWFSSRDIIQKYYTDKISVKYGQCWVYGGVLATLCRSIGIPCRVITNFESAHDSNGNLKIERVFDFEGKQIHDEESKGDSVWNFHVWNEVWMKRHDLISAYDGWQVIDSTPQEASNDDDGYRGQFACGPVPVHAIKLGELNIPYDAKFIFAEVNADVYSFRKRKADDKKLFDKIDQHRVGQYISTKAVGSYKREDVTEMYKFPEDSVENREAFHKALSYIQDGDSNDVEYKTSNFDGIKFNLDASSKIEIGQPISIVLSMKNESEEIYSMATKLICNANQYTGRNSKLVKQKKTISSIDPNNEKTINLDISWDDYKDVIMTTSVFKVICITSIPKENYDYFGELVVQLAKPKIKIDAKSSVVIDQPIEATLSFTNPLPIPLTDGQFIIMAPGLENTLKIKLENIVEPGALVTCDFTSIPKQKENSTIIVNFESNELIGVDGFLPIKVFKKQIPPLATVDSLDDETSEPVTITTEADVHPTSDDHDSSSGDTGSIAESIFGDISSTSATSPPMEDVPLNDVTETSTVKPENSTELVVKTKKLGFFASCMQCFNCTKNK